MEEIGQILHKDYLLLQDGDLSGSNLNERLMRISPRKSGI